MSSKDIDETRAHALKQLDDTPRITPQQLIERFCGAEAVGQRAEPGIEVQDRVTVARGFCGLTRDSTDALASGFADGYAFADYLAAHGWSVLSQRGKWPYLVYASWARDAEHALAEYRECDLTIWIYCSADEAQEALKKVR